MENPKIRFKGFTKDWEQRKLKDVIIDAYQGINTTADKVIYSNEGIPVLQAKHITAGSIDFTDVRYLKKEQYNEYFPKYTPQKGDMLFANIGTIGPSTIVENQGEFLIAWNILRIVFNKNLVDAYFVHLIFDKYKDSGYFERMQTGNATKFINKDNIFDINLFMPSEVEQHKIGGYFQKLDHLITLHQRKCEQTKKLKKYMLQKMFPQNGAKVPEIRFDGFTYDWEQRKLKEIADKVSEKNKNNEFSEPFTNSAEQGIISQKDYFDREIVNNENLDSYYIVRNDDFIYNPRISVTAPVGPINRNRLGRNGVMSPLYTVFRTHDIDNLYLEFYFKTTKWHRFMKLNGDSGARFDRFTISSTQFMEMPIPYPMLDEQRKIGEYFDSLDNLITLHQRQHKLHLNMLL